MLKLAAKHGIPLGNIIAVGDSENDVCMVRFAGIGIAFCSNNFVLNNVADYKIETKAFKNILKFAT